MAENEVKKEKANVKISIWFILFIVYLIFSLAFIMKQNATIEALNTELAGLKTKMESSIEISNSRTNAIIIQLENIIKDLKESAIVEDVEIPAPIVTPSLEVSTGVYAGAVDTTNAALTLAENNVASLTITTAESGDTVVNGTYSVAETTVVLTSDDGMTTYNFTAVEDGSLRFVINGIELTLLLK